MLYDSELGDFKIALLGDVMPTRRLAVFREERYLKLREIITSADAGFANLETCVHRYFEGHHGISGGTYMTTEPNLLEDLKWLGVNIVSTANNHAFRLRGGGRARNHEASGCGGNSAHRNGTEPTRGAQPGLPGHA
ncbi:MAG: CapA family protein [Candidatus Binatia bacterium]